MGMGNTGSVNSSLPSNFGGITNSKKIINDAKDYETDSLKLAFLITRKIFPIILISFQLFLYISSLNIITSYQVFLNFYSQKFHYYYELLTLTNYLSLSEYFINQNNINNQSNGTNPLAIYSNYSKRYETNIYENFVNSSNFDSLIFNKFEYLNKLKREFDSFEWLEQNDLFNMSERLVIVNITTTYNDHVQVDEVNLATGLYSVINMINIFLTERDYLNIHDIMTNLYSSIIPNANNILKTTLLDLISHIQLDEKTFTLVFIISITCIFTSGSLNYYTYIKIKDLAEKTFILIKDVPTKTIRLYLKNLDDFTRMNDENESPAQRDENADNINSQANSKRSNKKSKFYRQEKLIL